MNAGGCLCQFRLSCVLPSRISPAVTLLGLSALLLSGVCAGAGQDLDLENPTRFFTNLAARVLKSELNLDLTRIQIYPTNQYTPAVHRLLQVTVNLYDAAINRNPLLPQAGTNTLYAPTVFRPLFSKDANNNIYITNFVEETGTKFLSAPYRIWDLNDTNDLSLLPARPSAIFVNDSIYNVPLVIGAKKGFPNFNEFTAETAMQIMRRLEFQRPGSGGPAGLPAPVNQTNQIYITAVSNFFGVELWNSYSNAFPRDLQLMAGATVGITLLSRIGSVSTVWVWTTNLSTGASTNIPAGTWHGFNPNFPSSSFQLPIYTNAVLQPRSSNRFDELEVGFPVPQWWLSSCGRMRYALIDSGSGRIVDYAAFSLVTVTNNVTAKLAEGGAANGNSHDAPGDAWVTNRFNQANSVSTRTWGIDYQIQAGEGMTHPVWNSYNFDPSVQDSSRAVPFFEANLGLISPTGYTITNIFYAPWVPSRTIFQTLHLEANDPLVHYTIGDLTDLLHGTNFFADVDPLSPLNSLGWVNFRYSPWGGRPRQFGVNPDALNVAFKDPLIWSSDNWNFPSGEALGLEMIGRVHRGTPWQTIYLKSLDATANLISWEIWTGCTDLVAAVSMAPTNDWHMARFLVSLLSTNDPRSLFSVNSPDTNAWLAIMDGMSVLTNSSPQPTALIMTSNSPQAGLIAAAIQQERMAQSLHYYGNAGDILKTPELSIASPWLNTSNGVGISDEAYEKIPVQLLPLLREGSVGSVASVNSSLLVQFTGYDEYAYAVDVSSDLMDWKCVSINRPTNGVFGFSVWAPPEASQRFFRSRLLP